MSTKELLHQRIKLPLFHIYYNVIVTNSMRDAEDLLQELFPGLQLKIETDVCGYCALVSHFSMGRQLILIINTEDMGIDKPNLISTVYHECTHLSWYIMDNLGITVDGDNHEIQAYLMEELITKVSDVVEESKKIYAKNDSSDDVGSL